jgi:hypothetical protein
MSSTCAATTPRPASTSASPRSPLDVALRRHRRAHDAHNALVGQRNTFTTHAEDT